MKYILPVSQLVLAVSLLQLVSARQSRWCEGFCVGRVQCRRAGGTRDRGAKCSAGREVCCQTLLISSRQTRAVRTTRQRPRFRAPLAQDIAPTFPPSHQLAPITRKPGYLSPPHLYRGPVPAHVESHALAPVTRPPVLIPSEVRLPALGGPIRPNLYPALSSLPLRLTRGSPNTRPLGEERSEMCGITPAFGQTRIMGGSEARLGQFPWVGYLSIRGEGEDKMCGASLVSTRHVLTAAHCVEFCLSRDLQCDSHDSQLNMKLYLGEHNHREKFKHLPLQTYHVRKVQIHPNFTNSVTVRENGYLQTEPRQDVAILTLDREVVLSAHVRPICLPDSDVDISSGLVGVVTGWGRRETSQSSPLSQTLQAVKVPVLPPGLCAAQPGSSPPGPDQLCAGLSLGLHTACPGDSGGGLAVRDPSTSTWTILGIVSSGPVECGLTPVLYHNINTSRAWIRNIITSAGAR